MQKTIHKNRHQRLLFSALMSCMLFSPPLMAELVNGATWVIKPGDSLYKIARVIFPESPRKQAQLRRELVNQNPQAFKNGAGNISVGDKLQLPAFAVQQEAPVEAVVEAPPAQPAMPQPAAIEPVSTAKVEAPAQLHVTEPAAQSATSSTPDPADIIGKVIINVGKLSAENRGATRQLNRRSEIYRGDTLATGGRSLTQIRLSDGALLSLRPHTSIRIAQYSYNGTEDGTEKSIIELLKGGFRTITGAIGHINKQNYQIKTSMATIGIRGTHYSLVLCQQASCSGDGDNVKDGLYGGVADGSIVIENQSGLHTFNNDQFFHLTSAGVAPTETLIPPSVLHHKAQQANTKTADRQAEQQKKRSADKSAKSHPRRLAVIFEANQPNPVKRPIRLPQDINAPPLSQTTVAPNGSGIIISFNETDPLNITVDGASAPVTVNPNKNNTIILGPDRIPVAISETVFDIELGRIVTNEFAAISAAGTPTGVPSDLGRNTDLGVNWGRWNGDFTLRTDGSPIDAQNNMHFIYSDNITSAEQLAFLGGIKAFTTYTSTGGTLPTDNPGNTGSSFASISMGVDFFAQQITNYDISTSVTNDIGQQVSYSAGIFSPIPLDTLNTSFPIDGTGCASGACTGEASVLFVGPAASSAITSYQLNDIQANTSITGTALLTQDPNITQPQ